MANTHTIARTPKQHYEQLVQNLTKEVGIAQKNKNGYGSGLRNNGKVFVMMVKDRLAVKLPQARIDELHQQKKGEPYVYAGRVTKGWIVLDPSTEEQWLPLAKEAMRSVSAN